MKPQTGLSDKARETMGKVLNDLLADAHVLYVKTRNYHWNVTGPHFNDLHKVFEAQYQALEGEIDEIAERGRAVGVKAEATLADFLKRARIKEYPGEQLDAKGMLTSLLSDHETLARQLRKDVEAAEKNDDPATADFLTGLLEAHEKTVWMLRATLQD
ncbi:MAG TPA: DNA starvation/stationary phase protection protein [Planctomycetota bacterium]